MKVKGIYSVIIISIISGCFFKGNSFFMNAKTTDLANLFPQTTNELEQRTTKAITEAKQALDAILHEPKNRTFDNTIRAYDTLNRNLGIAGAAIHTIEMVHPDEKIRETAHAMIQKLQQFSIETLSNNIPLYKAITAYTDTADLSALTEEEQYFIKELLKGFKKSGLTLPEDEQKEIKKLKQELAEIELQFDTNITIDTRTIVVPAHDLIGLSEEFIASFPRTDEGLCILGIDYPTYFAVMDNCKIESTRETLWLAFNNKAYPINQAVLEKMIALRDTLAKKLGFASYADLIIDDEMAQNPTIVENFLNDIQKRAQIKAAQEIAQLKQELPEGVTLTKEGLLKPWDLAFVKNEYKKKHHTIDEQAIAEYFPMEHTIKMLLEIYEQFLGLQFKQLPTHNLFWHPDVQLIAVYNDGKEIGNLLLDLFPRPHKYGHACSITIVPALQGVEGVDVVLANFPKSTATQPSLLKRNDVKTFFHEFGHALHTLLGATEMSGFSGTAVKTDFVEMPSQMLEEWLYDPMILKKVSKHYKTGESLPDDIINKIIALKNFDSGDITLRQLTFGYMSLNYYKEGTHKDLTAIKHAAYTLTRPYLITIPDEHFEAGFGHLNGYSAQYYGYMWSKVFALDMFAHIKEQGLLNPVIGKKYIKEVLGKGGSKHPEILITNFLGRAPNSHAFFTDLGI